MPERLPHPVGYVESFRRVGLARSPALCDALAMSNPDELIGSKDACRILDVNRSTLTRWVKQGRVPLAHQLPGDNGVMLFRRADIDRVAAGDHAVAGGSSP